MIDHEGPSTAPAAGSPTSAARWFAPGLALVGLLGLLGRCAHLVTSGVDDQRIVEQGDAFWYATTAQNLADGQLFRILFTGRPTAEHPPLTVLALAPSSALFDSSTWAGRMTMVILGSLTIVVLGLAARRLAGPAAGLATAVLVAVSPALWPSDVLLMSETVTALALALLLWVAIVLAERPTIRMAALAGSACGLAALARTELLALLPLLVWPVLVTATRDGWRRRLLLGGVAAAALAGVLAPWVGLNLARFEEPVLISTNDGVTLVGANCDTTYAGSLLGSWNVEPCVTDAYARFEATKPGPHDATEDACPSDLQERAPCWDASEVSDALRADGLAYIGEHRTEVPRVVAARNLRVWGLYQPGQAASSSEGEARPGWTVTAGFAWTWALAPLGVYGLLLLRRRGRTIIPYLAMAAMVVVATTVSTGATVRPRLPWDVASCLPVGVAIATLAAAGLDRFRRSAGP